MQFSPDEDVLASIDAWFREARPEIVESDTRVQLGVALEEDAELLDALVSGGFDGDGDAVNQDEQAVAMVFHDLNRLANDIKSGVITPNFSAINRKEELDALCDKIVTIVGYARQRGYDLIGALREVDGSNWSKFVEGVAIKDENGKIIKGPDYYKPNLDPFV